MPDADTTPATPASTVINNGRTMQVVYRGTDNRMYMFALEQHNANPADPDQIGQGGVAGAGITTHSPAIARIRGIGGDDGIMIVHTGTTGHVYFQHAYIDILGAVGEPHYLDVMYEAIGRRSGTRTAGSERRTRDPRSPRTCITSASSAWECSTSTTTWPTSAGRTRGTS